MPHKWNQLLWGFCTQGSSWLDSGFLNYAQTDVSLLEKSCCSAEPNPFEKGWMMLGWASEVGSAWGTGASLRLTGEGSLMLGCVLLDSSLSQKPLMLSLCHKCPLPAKALIPLRIWYPGWFLLRKAVPCCHLLGYLQHPEILEHLWRRTSSPLQSDAWRTQLCCG